jgi:hypothetical protein
MAPHTTEVHEMGLLTADQSSVSERRKQSPWYTPHGWLLEILSMFASLCCTLALAFLLFTVQDQPYVNWKSYIGLNPTISTLTTVARGTLLLSASACLSQGKWLHLVKRTREHIWAYPPWRQRSRFWLWLLVLSRSKWSSMTKAVSLHKARVLPTIMPITIPVERPCLPPRKASRKV